MRLNGKRNMAKRQKDTLGEIRIERYKDSRYWGLWLGEKLLAVTVYKRGAESVAELIKELLPRTISSKYKD
jgi:hypothetical protein